MRLKNKTNNYYCLKLRNIQNQQSNSCKSDFSRERENSNSKTLFYKDCSLGSVKRDRQTETETDRDRQRHRDTQRDRDRETHRETEREAERLLRQRSHGCGKGFSSLIKLLAQICAVSVQPLVYNRMYQHISVHVKNPRLWQP